MKVILWIVVVFGAYKIWQFLYILFYSVYGDHALGEELKKCVELTLADSSAQSKEDKLLVLAAAIHNAYYYKFGGDLPVASAEIIAERYLNG